MAIPVALVGLGRWGQHFLRHFLTNPAIAPRCEVVALVDADGDRLEQLAHWWDLSPAVARLTDWRQLHHCQPLEAVVVATPAVTHGPIVEALLRRGCHVLVEKPLTLDRPSAQKLVDLAQQRGRVLLVDHTYLFHPAVQSGAMALRRRELGTPRSGYGYRTHLGPVRGDVDVLWDLAIHDLAIFNHWLGAEPLRVQAQGFSWLQPGRADGVWGAAVYPPQIPVQFQWGWADAHRQRRLGLVGDRGTLVLDELAPHPLVLHQGTLHPRGGNLGPLSHGSHGEDVGSGGNADKAENWGDLGNLGDSGDLGHPGGGAWYLGIQDDRLVHWQPETLGAVKLPVADREPLATVCRYFLDCIAQTPADLPWGYAQGAMAARLVGLLEAFSHSMAQGGAWIDWDFPP